MEFAAFAAKCHANIMGREAFARLRHIAAGVEAQVASEQRTGGMAVSTTSWLGVPGP
jgi:hypothetical protein